MHFLFFVEANEKWDNSKCWKHFTFQLNQPSWSCWLFHKACHGQTLPTVWVQTNKKNTIHWPIVHFELIGNFIEMIQRYKFKWSYKIPRGNPSVFVIAQMLSWSSQFVQVFQEVYCYLYRLKGGNQKSTTEVKYLPKGESFKWA